MVSRREQLKRLVLDCVVWRYTELETQKYVREGMNVETSRDCLNHLKDDFKQGCKRELAHLQKDRHGYINNIVFDRIEEIRTYQRRLWEIISNASTKPEAKIKAIDFLVDTSHGLLNV